METLKSSCWPEAVLLFKNKEDWTANQEQRAAILFEHYPDLEKAYQLSTELSWIFEKTTDKLYGLTGLAKWHEKVRQAGFKSFNTISRSKEIHYKTILNYVSRPPCFRTRYISFSCCTTLFQK